MTVLQLIKMALKACGAVGIGQRALASDTADALTYLQMMLAQWQERRWLVYSLIDLPLTSTGAQSYTFGTGGDFNTPWVDHLEAAYFRQTITSEPQSIDYPVRLINAREDYNRISLKSLSTFPQYCFYDAAYPLANVFFWPIPPAAQYELHLTAATQLPLLTSLTQTLILPPAYQEAVVQNLAVRLRVHFQLPEDQVLTALARVALQTIKLGNAQVQRLQMPDNLTRGGFYNVFSDQAN